MMFKDQAELLAFFSQGGAAQLSQAAAQVAPAKVEAPKPPKAAATPTAAATKPAKSEPAAASPSEGNAPAASAAPAAAPTTAPAASSSSEVDYPTLQKAVFALANKDRAAASALVGSFNVKTFKELDSSKWGDALAAVNAKLAELGA